MPTTGKTGRKKKISTTATVTAVIVLRLMPSDSSAKWIILA